MDIDTIEQIVTLIIEHPVAEISVEQDGNRIHVRRPASVFAAPPPAAHPSETSSAETPGGTESLPTETEMVVEAEAIVLTSPMVGLFRHLASPIPYGGLIALHQTVGSIESMKLMNDVPAEHSGRVVEVLIEDGAPVEYGQPLFRLVAA